MKKIFTSLTLVFCCTNIFAQQAKSCLFIGTYEKNKRGICGDYELVHEEIKDYTEYAIKRTQFQDEHKNQSPNTKFVSSNESVICYQYVKKNSGWNCNSNVISSKTGKSLEDCNKQLADQLAKYPKDFTTQPNNIYTWQGKGSSGNEYVKDYGGLNGKFITANTSTKNAIVVKLTNTTTDKLATVLFRTDDGKIIVEYIYPGSTFTKKYDAKKLEVQVLYQDSKVPEPINVMEFIKSHVRDLLENENGELKIRKWDPTCMCVRG